MTKKSTMRIGGAPEDGKVGTATIRGYAQRKLAEIHGTQPNSDFDDTIAAARERVIPQPQPSTRAPEIIKTADQVGGALKRFQALGRLPVGKMNKTEAAYAKHLDLLRHAGEILWYRFEGLKIRLADNTFLTPDFVVMRADCSIKLVDVKGAKPAITDDAHVKMKVAAEQYPFTFEYAFPNTKGRSGWITEEV